VICLTYNREYWILGKFPIVRIPHVCACACVRVCAPEQVCLCVYVCASAYVSSATHDHDYLCN